MKNLINNLKNLPVAVSGLALGIAGLGNILGSELHLGFRYFFALIALVILTLVTIKKLNHPKILWNEISHPVLGSFIPAYDMALMIIASIIAKHSLIFGQILWYLAIILHIIFAGFFFYHRYKQFDINHMLPSWFIPPVGIVVACVTSESMNSPIIAQTIFYFGFIAYLIILPIMLYRVIFGAKIEDSQLPAFAVMGAPASLCLSGYLTILGSNANPIIIGLLLALALMMTALILLSMFRINHFRIKFIPIYASFTFPLSISATGTIKYAKFLQHQNINADFWYNIGVAELIIASVVIVWVLVMMTKFVYQNVFHHKK